jgi:hypothetical protein
VRTGGRAQKAGGSSLSRGCQNRQPQCFGQALMETGPWQSMQYAGCAAAVTYTLSHSVPPMLAFLTCTKLWCARWISSANMLSSTSLSLSVFRCLTAAAAPGSSRSSSRGVSADHQPAEPGRPTGRQTAPHLLLTRTPACHRPSFTMLAPNQTFTAHNLLLLTLPHPTPPPSSPLHLTRLPPQPPPPVEEAAAAVEHVPQLISVGQVAVVDQVDTQGAVDKKGLSLLGRGGASSGVAHVTNAHRACRRQRDTHKEKARHRGMSANSGVRHMEVG